MSVDKGRSCNFYLAMIDFDHTVVGKNTDSWIYRLFPKGELPEELKKSYSLHNDWHRSMQEKFDMLHTLGVQPADIIQCQREIPLVQGMDKVLRYVGQLDSFDVIITSDSNSVFIDSILDAYGLSDTVNNILTNPAYFDEEGHLILRPHHTHTCETCPSNMCKRMILRNYLSSCSAQGRQFQKIFLIGDGTNDYCPCVLLKEEDVIFARKGYRLHKKLVRSNLDQSDIITASVIAWENGEEILEVIEGAIKTPATS